MPGVKFSYRTNGQPAFRKRYPFAKSMNGTGTPPAATLQPGDFVALTTNASLATSSTPVVRMLLAADKTAHYEEGGVRAGVLGIYDSQVNTNSSGVVMAQQSAGGVITRTPGMASMNPLHPCGHAQDTIVVATADTVFEMNLATAAASQTALAALRGTLGGITLSTTSGVTTYTVNTTDTGEDLMLEIVDVDISDPNLKRVFVRFLGTGLTPTGSYMQYDTGTNYSTQ